MAALPTSRPARDLASLAVLALLSEHPTHPYGLQAQIRERHIDFAAGKTRALYHAVERLQLAGYIAPLETTRAGRRPERTVYQLTDRGRDELHDWLRQLLMRERDPVAFRAALSLVAHLPVEDALRALESRQVELECTLQVRRGVDRVLRERYALPRAVLLDHECDAAACEAELQWLRGVIDDLRSQRLGWDATTSPFAERAPTPEEDGSR